MASAMRRMCAAFLGLYPLLLLRTIAVSLALTITQFTLYDCNKVCTLIAVVSCISIAVLVCIVSIMVEVFTQQILVLLVSLFVLIRVRVL